VAPETTQVTTLQEHRRADAWPIMDGKTLDIGYYAL
jgi:hypothetical protein